MIETNLADELNRELKKKGKKLVLGKAPKTYDGNKSEVVAYVTNPAYNPDDKRPNRRDGVIIIKPKESHDIFLEFPIEEDSVYLLGNACGTCYAPSLSKYGFPSNPEFFEELESIVKEVNDSIEFDFKKAAEALGTVNSNKKEITKWIKHAQYKPTGNEIQKGICSDSGEQIRERLKKVDEIKTVHYTLDLSTDEMHRTHDTTFVYNPETFEWALLNSKSPYLQFDVFPKEEIKGYIPTLKEHFGIDD